MKVEAKGKRENVPPQVVEVMVFDYFVNTKPTPLQFRDELCDTGF